MKNANVSHENKNGNNANRLLAAALVAPYLPYKVMAYDERQENKTDYIAGMYRGNLDFENWSPLDCGQIENYKLCLRPISDLVKEIEHDGVKFVPLVELAKIIHQKTDPNDLKCFSVMDNIGYYGIYCDWGIRFETNLMYYYEIKSWYLKCNGTHMAMFDHYKLFQKLFEWHFDVFDLIPKKLAVAF